MWQVKKDHLKNKVKPANDSIHPEECNDENVVFETQPINHFKDISHMSNDCGKGC